jgi:hypothetical protein
MYRLIKDDDGHLYVIPADKLDDASRYFDAVYKYWDEMPDDEEEPPEPDWLKSLGCAMSCVKFPSYEID